MLTLDLVAEEDATSQDYDHDCDDCWENELQAEVIRARQRADTDVSKLRVASKEPKVKTSSLPRGSERSWGRSSHRDAAKVLKKHQVQVEEDCSRVFSWTGSDQVLGALQVLQAQSRTPQPGKRFSTHARSRCASMDEVLSSR